MLIPFAIIATAKKSRRARLTEAMLPAMIPLPPTQAVAMSAITADQLVRTEERRIDRARGQEVAKAQVLLDAEKKATQALLADTVAACKVLITKAAGAKLTAAEVAVLPALKAQLATLPAAELGQIVA
jgi:hypothetical protein